MSAYYFEKATFGMGNFWEAQKSFTNIHGVLETRVGFSGGSSINPNSENVGDHTEVIQIDFDPKIIPYQRLLDYFFANHDCFKQEKRKFMSVIFYSTPQQEIIARKILKDNQDRADKKIITKVLPLREFHMAEDFNQNYFEKLEKL